MKRKKLFIKASRDDDNLKVREIEKLKRSTYFDEDSLKEIREDLDLLTDGEIKKNRKTIENNNKIILNSITAEQLLKFNK